MKFCVIGYGRWGRNLYSTLINQVGKKNLYVYDLDPKAIDEGINTFNNLDEIVDDDNIENILISTPATTHFELSKKFLESGKNVFCEKPVALFSSEVDELIEIAKRTNRIFIVGHTFLFNDSINYIKENIEKDAINLKIISGRYSNYSTNVNDVDVLWDFGPHVVSISNYIIGQIPKSTKIFPLYYDERKKLSACNIYLEYERGINAVFELSWLSVDKKREIDFIGESKMYRWNDLKPSSPVEYIKKVYPEKNIVGPYKHFHTILNKTEIPPIEQTAPLENELNYFISSLKSNNSNDLISGLTFSKGVVETVEKISSQLN
tara:strand:- start:123 stop:1082 length:960 start_codon:yes stop_codon:yes gene_type:complete